MLLVCWVDGMGRSRYRAPYVANIVDDRDDEDEDGEDDDIDIDEDDDNNLTILPARPQEGARGWCASWATEILL